MQSFNWHLLQLFGDTGSAADTITGDMAADAGQQDRANNPPRDAAGETPKMRWEEIMADPEYNARMQAVVQSRLRSAKDAEEKLKTLTPALERLAARYGLDGKELDHAALARAVQEEGAAPEKENAPGSQSVRTGEPSRFTEHIRGLERQAAALQRHVPDFDLRRELQNPVFVRLTAPGSGLTVEDAYFAVHRARLQSAAVETAARKISNSIRSGSYRPRENGTTAQAASVAAFDYRNATAQQRAELKQRIREAAARGEKLYPGR